MLRRLDSRWGTFWQGDFTSFDKPGVYQIETEHQFSLPFAIDPAIYDRLVRGYLVYLRAQRSGCDVPRVRPATNTDDAVLDTDGSYVPVAGGWYDAGDLRKWMSLTAFHLEALFRCWHSGPEAFRPQIVEEIAWGNKWIHSMITPEGRLWEDVGGGVLRGAQGYDAGWWCENHPGCLADNADNRATDNVPASGDERRIRTTYNPWVPCIPQVGVLISLGFSGGRIRGRSWWAIGQGGG
jgi:hypothetical protein